ncbi:ABC transporter permease [uncultured Sphaerochaeta sp.]|uniref:ABC transporter permease n=1 Tax=uncultured Sphaerochaeta sp. TaxID=886478 RepID=UPI002A0A8285|nr:ABC transporter permease [uncultured Sphaerochaeta sp.]
MRGKKFYSFLVGNIAIITLFLLIVFNCLFTKNFVSMTTFFNLMMQTTKIVLLGMGMTLVIATGGIDISVGSAMSLAAVISALTLVTGNYIGLILALVVMVLIGMFSGVLVAKFKILPMVVTLAMFYILRGAAKGISGRGTITYALPNLTAFFTEPIGGVLPIHFFIMLLAIAVMYFVVNKTKFGMEVELLGNNPNAAMICGIHTTRIIIMCYAISMFFAWGAGLLDMFVVSSADPSKIGLDIEIDAIAATLIGGTPITGGYPNVIGTVCGAFILQIITMMCNMLNIPFSIALMIKAALIIGALYLHEFANKEN